MPLFDALKDIAGDKISEVLGNSSEKAEETITNVSEKLNPEEITTNVTEQVEGVTDNLNAEELTNQASEQVTEKLEGASSILDSVKNFFGK